MSDDYISVIVESGERYEIRPTDGLLNFLQRLAEGEMLEQHGLIRTRETPTESKCPASLPC